MNADTLPPLAPLCVVMPGTVACRCAAYRPGSPTVWRNLADAWMDIGSVLTWGTLVGAQLFADMNGGTVTPLTEVFREPGIVPAVHPAP